MQHRKRPSIDPRHPAERYAAGVFNGSIIAGRWVRLACQRYYDDCARMSGLFNRRDAQRTIDFFAGLNHSKGEWAGRPFVLADWQQFIIWNLFGWKTPQGTRRFRSAYIDIAR